MLRIAWIDKFDPFSGEIEPDFEVSGSGVGIQTAVRHIQHTTAPALLRWASVIGMRLGVLDVGSNTVHLLVVDAYRGGHPTPTRSMKSELRLAECLDANGALSETGEQALIKAVAEAKDEAARQGCDDLLAFATSAVRDAANSKEVINAVIKTSGVDVQVLKGPDEARLTFLAVRRWYGWSAGRLLSLDIGGGSFEIAIGIDEEPNIARSVPLGAGRLTREWFTSDPPSREQIKALREHIATVLAQITPQIRADGVADHAAASSKTFRSLARLTGAAPSSEGIRVARELTLNGLRQLIPFISRMASTDLATLDGVSTTRAHQLLAGAIVAEAAMEQLGCDRLEICPWALREGVILRRLDWLDGI